ncbi:MAG: metalloregulator ArsR/SmtB family transcription factor [Steroidobacteraceae bacterium]
MSRRTRSALPKPRAYAPIFAALGDETRLAIVTKLASGESHSIAQLTAETELTRQAVTKHLRVLEGARLVRSVRSGRESLFELDPSPIRAVRDYAEVVSQQWDDALSRLKAFVEK